MLTAILLDDFRVITKDIALSTRASSDRTFVSKLLCLCGDIVGFLCQSCESSDVCIKARLIERASSSASSLAELLNIAVDSGIISELKGITWLKSLKSLNSRLKKALLDAKRRSGLMKNKLPPARVLFDTARLEFKTPSECDLTRIADLLTEFDDSDADKYRKIGVDAVRDLIKNGNETSVISIYRKNSCIIGAVRAKTDSDNPRRMRIDIGIVKECRMRGYFIEAINGTVRYLLGSGYSDVLAVNIADSRRYLIDGCIRCGFRIEGIRIRASYSAENVTAMSISRSD